jgi:hypothetical protein
MQALTFAPGLAIVSALDASATLYNMLPSVNIWLHFVHVCRWLANAYNACMTHYERTRDGWLSIDEACAVARSRARDDDAWTADRITRWLRARSPGNLAWLANTCGYVSKRKHSNDCKRSLRVVTLPLGFGED